MNHGFRAACYLATLFGLILGFSSLFAQEDPRLWNEGGMAVKQADHLEWTRQAAADSSGSICVVWSDTRTDNRDIYAQVINTDGTLAWQEEGIPLVTHSGRQESPVITAVADGWIVAWIEWTDLQSMSYPAYSAAVYAQKLDLEGDILWPQDGALVANIGLCSSVELRIVPDSDRGALIAWTDWSRIQVQRIRRWGAIGWNEVVSLGNPDDCRYGIEAVSDGQGNMLLAWESTGDPYDMNIYGAKIMEDGSLPWGDGESGIPICTMEEDQEDISICPDHATDGFYCAWKHKVNDQSEEDLYLQRIHGDGTVLWETNGILLCNALYEQNHVRLAASMDDSTQDGVLCVWADHRAFETEHFIFAQKVSSEGVMSWDENGTFVCGSYYPGYYSNRENDAHIYSDYSGGAVISWNDTRSSGYYGAYYDLYAARLNESGVNLWSECGEPIVEQHSRLNHSVLILNEDASAFDVVFENDKAGYKNIEYQRLSVSDGSTLFTTGTVIRAGLEGYVTHLETISLSDERVAFVWSDSYAGRYGSAVLYQIVNASGEFELPDQGTLLAPDTSEYLIQYIADLASDGNGGFFAGLGAREDLSSVRLTRVNAEGEIVCDPQGVPVFESPHDQYGPMLSPDGSGGCYVAWTEDDSSFIRHTFVMRCDENCNPLWSQPAVPIGFTTHDQQIVNIVSSQDCCILLCDAGDSNEEVNYVARVCSDGSVDWSRLLCDESLVQEDPCMIEDENGGVYISWSDNRSISANAIFVQHISSEGEDLWLHNGRRVVQEQAYGSQMVYSETSGLYLVWSNRLQHDGGDLFAQRIDEAGDPVWDSPGVALCTESGYQGNPKLILNNLGGFTCVWEDRRDYYSDIYGTDILPDGSTSQAWWVEQSGGCIGSAYQAQMKPVLAAMGNHRVCVSWIDRRASGETKYAWDDVDEAVFDLYTQIIETGTMSGTEDLSETVPLSFALHQNYPNPFNPSTTISFAIPNAGQTSLIVYDLLGRTVETLMNKPLTAGNYHVQWNANSLPSGVYFYRLTSGKYTDVKKTVLLK